MVQSLLRNLGSLSEINMAKKPQSISYNQKSKNQSHFYGDQVFLLGIKVTSFEYLYVTNMTALKSSFNMDNASINSIVKI